MKISRPPDRLHELLRTDLESGFVDNRTQIHAGTLTRSAYHNPHDSSP